MGRSDMKYSAGGELSGPIDLAPWGAAQPCKVRVFSLPNPEVWLRKQFGHPFYQ